MTKNLAIEKCLFRAEDKLEFKRQFAIQWLAAREAVEYERNCARGWSRHTMPVEDARSLADKAWENWCEHIGVVSEEDEEF